MEEKNKLIRFTGEFKRRWWLKPICWVFGHKKATTSIYGVRSKQCSRCGKDFFTEFESNLYKGEIGELYGYRIKFPKEKRNEKSKED